MRGVGGWLLLLCVGLTVLSPILVAVGIVRDYLVESPYFERFPRLRVVLFIDLALRVALTAYGMWVGMRLGTASPRAVQAAKRYFQAAVAYLIVAALLPFAADLPPDALPALAMAVARQTIPALIGIGLWYAYLVRSKRVQATYPDATC
jgi:hypothetical protein